MHLHDIQFNPDIVVVRPITPGGKTKGGLKAAWYSKKIPDFLGVIYAAGDRVLEKTELNIGDRIFFTRGCATPFTVEDVDDDPDSPDYQERLRLIAVHRNDVRAVFGYGSRQEPDYLV